MLACVVLVGVHLKTPMPGQQWWFIPVRPGRSRELEAILRSTLCCLLGYNTLQLVKGWELEQDTILLPANKGQIVGKASSYSVPGPTTKSSVIVYTYISRKISS